MEIRPHRIIKRKKTKKIMVGNVAVGSDAVISIQSMTNTITSDASATKAQQSSWAAVLSVRGKLRFVVQQLKIMRTCSPHLYS